MKINNFILTGFDRSGTSAISRTLAMHPSVELVFRPFNGGSVREKMYEILSDENVSDADIRFFSELSKGRFDSAYVVSWWHKKYSTISDHFLEDRLHLLITNLNHFTVPWVSTKFPNVESWAIWRNPLDIVQSCLENNFLGDWYEDALVNVIKAVRSNEFLSTHFLQYEECLDDEVKKISYLLAVRNTYLLNSIEHGKIVDYDLFRTDPNSALRPVLNYFGLDSSYDFSGMLNQDLNSVPGKVKYAPGIKKKHTFSEENSEFLSRIMMPLYNAFREKSV
jgi:hypothetical protein